MKCQNNEIQAADSIISFTSRFKFYGFTLPSCKVGTSQHKGTSICCPLVITQNPCLEKKSGREIKKSNGLVFGSKQNFI